MIITSSLPRILSIISCIFLAANGLFAQLTSNRTGKLDRSFGENGMAVGGPAGSLFGDSVVLADGSILSVGSSQWNGKFSVRLTKHRADGSPDPGFGEYGYRTHTFPSDAFGASLTVLPDGKLVVVGSISQGGNFIVRDFLVLRLLPNGELDNTFGSGGYLIKDLTIAGSSQISSERGSSVLLEPDGNILLVGMVDRYEPGETRTTAYTTLLRITPNGIIDPSFNGSGMLVETAGSNDLTDADDRPVTATRLSDGKILLRINVRKESAASPETFAFHAIVRRLLADGSPDNGFSDDSTIDLSVGYTPTYPSFVSNSIELASGKLLVLTSDGVYRLNNDGTVDLDFGSQGRLPVAGVPCRLSDLAGMSDGSFIVTKNCTRSLAPTGVRYYGQLEKYWPDGSPDLRFGNGGKTVVDLGDIDLFFGRVHVLAGNFALVTGSKGAPSAWPFPSLPMAVRLYTSRKL